jgi:hypothetical protein
LLELPAELPVLDELPVELGLVSSEFVEPLEFRFLPRLPRFERVEPDEVDPAEFAPVEFDPAELAPAEVEPDELDRVEGDEVEGD